MATRKIKFITGEYYHVFNRGVDKRKIFLDQDDMERFFQSMSEFNSIKPIGSLYENSFRQLRSGAPKFKKLVDFVCYCLVPNHYHFILKQLVDKGIEKFMQKIGGYPKYFNEKYKRSGALFQGPFKAIHIDSNEYLLHLSVYINLNNRVHGHENKLYKSELTKSSWSEYAGENKNQFCSKDIILKQFKNIKEYKNFSDEALEWIKENKESAKYLLEEST